VVAACGGVSCRMSVCSPGGGAVDRQEVVTVVLQQDAFVQAVAGTGRYCSGMHPPVHRCSLAQVGSAGIAAWCEWQVCAVAG